MDNPLWNYSLAAYSNPGVAQHCLEAQDECGVDVNLLLYAAWLASQAQVLDERRSRSAMACTDTLRQQVIRPLRTLRRQWKAWPELADLREQLKQLELAAERELQDGLWDWHRQQPAPASGGSLSGNLEWVLRLAGESPAAASQRAQVLAAALSGPVMDAGWHPGRSG
ncbi:TIGR02444 family protein [Parahaliea maris]|nr:TIGR02444 family protein [Parahaliea maris]